MARKLNNEQYIFKALLEMPQLPSNKGSPAPSSNLITSLFVLKKNMIFPYIQQPSFLFLSVLNALENVIYLYVSLHSF